MNFKHNKYQDPKPGKGFTSRYKIRPLFEEGIDAYKMASKYTKSFLQVHLDGYEVGYEVGQEVGYELVLNPRRKALGPI